MFAIPETLKEILQREGESTKQLDAWVDKYLEDYLELLKDNNFPEEKRKQFDDKFREVLDEKYKHIRYEKQENTKRLDHIAIRVLISIFGFTIIRRLPSIIESLRKHMG